MKSLIVSQLVKTESAQKEARNRSGKGSLEPASQSAAFSQFWNALLQPKNTSPARSKHDGSGEIEIRFVRTKQPQPSERTSVLPERQTAVFKEPSVTAPPTRPGAAPVALHDGAKETVRQTAEETGPTSKATAEPVDADSRPAEELAAAKEVARRVVQSLQENGTMESLKPGDVAQVKMRMPVSKARSTLVKSQTPSSPSLAKGKAEAGDNVKTFVFKYSGKDGWQPARNTKVKNQNSVWRIRILFTDAAKTETASGAVPGKTSAKGVGPENNGKNVTVRFLQAKTVNGQKESALQARFQVEVENPADAKVKATGGAKGQNSVITLLLGKGSDQTSTAPVAKVSAGQNESFSASADASDAQTPGKGKAETGTLLNGKAGLAAKEPTVKSADPTSLSAQAKVALSAAKGLSKGPTSLAPKAAVKPSVLIDRIESLLAQATKSKSAANMKMQIKESPFGRMDLKFDSKTNRLSVVLESDKAKEAFLRLTPLIQNNLAEKGYVLNGVQVSVNSFATQEHKEGLSGKRKAKQEKHQSVEGKEVINRDTDPNVMPRRFGYNTLEVTA